ncbi:hypothetical protein LJC14_07435, partial [Treponema sp. OttesenSCG-928-L16]|nr:hypothetical protein [Treponema sp. OttesenSCG-928-L16]
MNIKAAALLLLTLLITFSVAADPSEISPSENDTVPEIPLIREKPFIVFNEGAAATWVTRIIKQDGRSNFVFTDFMPGAYIGIKTMNMQPLNSTIRLAAYYPLLFKFNDVPQYEKNY